MSRCVLEGPYQIFDKKSWFKSNFSTAELESFQFLQIFVSVVASVFSVGGELKLQFELKKLLKLKVKNQFADAIKFRNYFAQVEFRLCFVLENQCWHKKRKMLFNIWLFVRLSCLVCFYNIIVALRFFKGSNSKELGQTLITQYFGWRFEKTRLDIF